MTHRIRRVAVLGAGTMGAAIAAHCANAGLEVDLLDIAPDEPDGKNKDAVKAGSARMKKAGRAARGAGRRAYSPRQLRRRLRPGSRGGLGPRSNPGEARTQAGAHAAG